MTTTKKRPVPTFDPHTASYLDERHVEGHGMRLAFACPSRRPGQASHLLTTDDNGDRASCTCEGYTYSRAIPASCCHAAQSATIARLALANHLAVLPEAELARLGRGLTRGSLWCDVIGDEVGKRARMKDKAALSARARQAREELFG